MFSLNLCEKFLFCCCVLVFLLELCKLFFVKVKWGGLVFGILWCWRCRIGVVD